MLDIPSKEEPYVRIEVRNPRTHISREKALYTDYEITVKTNNIAFSCNESCVRRRYSDFQWLKKRLITLYKWVTSPPELPPKRLFGRFQRQFLKRRQQGLQNFLERIVEDNQYLSDVAIHLFLQSNLSVKEIERHLDGMSSDGDILDSLQSQGKGRQSALSRSMTEMPLNEIEACLEHDSGCCYSTTSSINDLIQTPVCKTREDWRYYMSLPANLDKVDVNECENKTLQQEPRRGVLSQVDSGHLTSGSHQSLNKPTRTSESDCDFMLSMDYDADYESNIDDECAFELQGSTYSLFELGKRFRLEQALELLRSRPKISERILMSDNDSDEEFHESEYDVIESHDENEADTLKRKHSINKKKIGRSLSDAVKPKRKITRRESQSFNNKTDQNKNQDRFQSMPNIRAHAPLRLTKSASDANRSLAAYREEEAETIKQPRLTIESPTTSSSMGRGKSDDADESVVPNSEMDCYSTWNSPPKVKNFFIDSSDMDLSCENSNDPQPPTQINIARRLLERLTFSRHTPRLEADKPTLVSGRFRVSVIREEENSSRRGSASSNDLTLRYNSGPSTDKQTNLNVRQFERPESCSPKSVARHLNFDEKENVPGLAFDTHYENGQSDTQGSDTTEGQSDDAEDNLNNSVNIVTPSTTEPVTVKDHISDSSVPTLPTLASTVLHNAVPKTDKLEDEIVETEADSVLENSIVVDYCVEPVEILVSYVEEKLNVMLPPDADTTIDTTVQKNSPEDHCQDTRDTRGSLSKDGGVLSALSGICLIDGLKDRAVSPTIAMLKTYDVIPDIPCCLEDYDIVDANRN